MEGGKEREGEGGGKVEVGGVGLVVGGVWGVGVEEEGEGVWWVFWEMGEGGRGGGRMWGYGGGGGGSGGSVREKRWGGG